jgi:hypothetical protein
MLISFPFLYLGTEMITFECYLTAGKLHVQLCNIRQTCVHVSILVELSPYPRILNLMFSV